VAYQFFHVESYARASTRKGDQGSRSMRSVFAEAMREEGDCPHIAQPVPPGHVFGASLAQVEREANDWAEQAKDSAGRKLKADGQCLLAGVISAPRDPAEWAGNWEDFRAAAVDWLKAKYGDRLRAVVEHTEDESHPHLHFYCVAKVGERFDTLHEGRAAMADAKRRKLPKGAQAAAFAKAMREVQDDFHSQVGARFGMLRLGAGKRRLGSAAHKAEKAQAIAIARSQQSAEAKERAAAALADKAKAEADAIRLQAEQEAAAAIAKATASARDELAAAEGLKVKAAKDESTAQRYKEEARAERNKAREEAEAVAKEREEVGKVRAAADAARAAAEAARVAAVAIREKAAAKGERVRAWFAGLLRAGGPSKAERELVAKLEETKKELAVQSTIANEKDHALRRAKAYDGIELANARGEETRKRIEREQRAALEAAKIGAENGSKNDDSTPKPP
jgi:hypothetical protein